MTNKTYKIPTISKNSPLKIDDADEVYEESKVEKRGKLLFILGIIFCIFILGATWGVFALSNS